MGVVDHANNGRRSSDKRRRLMRPSEAVKKPVFRTSPIGYAVLPD
jgi:hypothetical protein